MDLTGKGNRNPLQYPCLENTVDRGAWWAAAHRVAQSWTWLNRLSMHACIGEGKGNPLHYSCLEIPGDRRAWWAAVYGVTQSQTWLKRLSSSSMDLTFQVPMQYCSSQHWTLLPSTVTSTTGCCFCFGSISSFFLELFLHWSPVVYWAPTDLGVPLSVSYPFAFS